jgi:NAD(P)-dependent dehydrogenase (short-subunit alcohol dehydrogenase family)
MTALQADALSGKIVLVSGGTQGVGAAVARRAAECGAEAVAFSGRRAELGDPMVDEIAERGSSALFVRADLAEVEQARASVSAVIAEFGRIDCVVNAAGLVDRGSLLETTPELFDRHIAINLRAPFFLMQAAITDMLSRQAPGSIVNIGSLSEHTGQSFLTAYSAAKGGLATLTRNVAHAHRWDRIRVNGLNIGWSATEGEDAIQRQAHGASDGWLVEAASQQPFGRLGDPSQIADMVVFLLSDASGVVTGSVIDWDQIVVGTVD